MKRAIFQPGSIELNIEHELFPTPIGPERLQFEVGEEMLVATPRREVPAGIGEYQFLYTVGAYRGSDSDQAERLFGRAGWRHLYELTSVQEIEPFSLEDLASAAGTDADAVMERYRGQTQHHRIIRDVSTAHEPYFRQLLRPKRAALSGYTVVRRNRLQAAEARAHSLSRAELVRRLKRMSDQNEALEPGKQYRSGQTQRRKREFVALIKAFYDDTCQVCGGKLFGPAGARSEVHHLAPWTGDGSDHLGNVIVVCPNDHARFEIGALRWTSTGLETWEAGGWGSAPLAVDEHLLTPLA